MPTYAIKIGEIRVRSSRPISPEERAYAIAELARAFKGTFLITQSGLEVVADAKV